MTVVGGCGIRHETTSYDLDTIATNNRGVALMGRFDFDAARQAFAGLVEQHADDADLQVNLAIAVLNRQQEGDEETSMGILDGVLARNPDHLRAKYVRGHLSLHGGDSRAAFDDFLAVAKVDPGDPDAAYHVGQSLMQLKKHEEALIWFDRAVEGDPYLRSAYYRAFQALQRLGRKDEAEGYIGRFQALDGNPRAHLMEFKYTKMGQKAEVVVIGTALIEVSSKPDGPIFESASPIVSGGFALETMDSARAPNTTACDFDGDGDLDLFVAGARVGAAAGSNLVLLASRTGHVVTTDHPLARVRDVNTALWGDVDNDGLSDVYLCRRGPNQLWLQTAPGEWSPAPDGTGVAGGDLDTVDGGLFDADHDGDLDIFLVQADGDNDLLNNNRDGSFRSLGVDRGLTGDGRASRAVVVTDLDGDFDADLIVLNREPPHQVYENRLLWEYVPATGWDPFVAADVRAAVAGDVDADGSVELYTLSEGGAVDVWIEAEKDVWSAERLVTEAAGVSGSDRLEIGDADGDGVLDLLISGEVGWALLSAVDGRVMASDEEALATAGFVALDPNRGPSIVGWSPGVGPIAWQPGSGRFPFAAIRLSGLDDDANSMRTNASGIGARVAARVGSRWTVIDTYRSQSGPGQSLQPVLVGLGGMPAVDFVALDWSDAVFQTEMGLAPDAVHTIVETQRQISSCPVLFAWDGEEFSFVTDFLGVGGMGHAIGPGEYAEPRPWENVLLPQSSIRPRDGRILLKLSEPMEEAAYIDAVRMVAYDLPPKWHMTLDERMHILGVPPTGRPVVYRTIAAPVQAYNERGDDVTDAMAAADRVAAPVGELDRRFIGRLRGEHILTLEFDEAINWIGRRLVLVADGWVEYPYSSTRFAAWQAGADYRAPTLEARGADGRWVVVLEQFGYPAGMPRQISVPLPRLPSGTKALRLRSNQEVYWDRVIVVGAEVTEEIVRHGLDLRTAVVEQTGFARRTTGSERLPHFDFDQRAPLWDTRVQPGYYTKFGDATELISAADDALAIIGPGEGIHLEFIAPPEGPAPGWTRVYVLEAEGWCKDMDLYTRDGGTLGPMPAAGRASSSTAMLSDAHNRRWNGS